MHPILILAALMACKKDKADDTGTGGEVETVSCTTTLTYAPTTADLDGVYVAGEFNGWDSQANPMTPVGDGTYTIDLELEPGPQPYKFVEFAEWDFEGYEGWSCDPDADLIHCDEGYITPGDTSWNHACAPSTNTSCNSMIIVPDCTLPEIEVDTVAIDRSGLGITVHATGRAGVDGGELKGSAFLDGEEIAGAFDGSTFSVTLSGLEPTRHTMRLALSDKGGGTGDEAYIPFWLDVTDPRDQAWRQGAVYFAFLDRLASGDTANDSTEGATDSYGDLPIQDYMGGDLAGLIDLLPYLDDLGVTTIWLSNLQDNAEGAWAADCETTMAGYHAYWPDSATAVEEHFGDADTLRELVDQAHARNMRVMMDWVANHVHEDHPYYAEPDWYNDYIPCKVGDDYSGFQNYPETCWFAEYLPDIDYTNPAPLYRMVEDALWWVTTYELDGFRVDAAKHMTHAVAWNLEARIREEIEHKDAGGDEEFWTVGETFDGYETIAAYLHADNGDATERLQLDGQFDFPMFWTIQSVFGTESGHLGNLEDAISGADYYYGDALMSNFLGNHDVVRFSTYAAEGEVDSCWSGTDVATAGFTSDDNVYARMRLAWTFLFTQPPPPLVYYGDEIGMPGYSDPDSRQPLWWYTGDISGGAVQSADDMAALMGSGSAAVVRHVAALGKARQEHPSFWRGTRTEWWKDSTDWTNLWAYARVDDETGDGMLVIINRSWDDATLTNALAYTGLPSSGTYRDVLTGDSFTASGDSLTVSVSAYTSRVLVPE